MPQLSLMKAKKTINIITSGNGSAIPQFFSKPNNRFAGNTRQQGMFLSKRHHKALLCQTEPNLWLKAAYDFR
jgi:hypothetical protein